MNARHVCPSSYIDSDVKTLLNHSSRFSFYPPSGKSREKSIGPSLFSVEAVALGTDSMVVQSIFGSRRINPARELDEGMLSRLATETGGQYFRARDREGLEQIYQILDELQPIEGEARKMRPQTSLFMYPLAASLGLTLLMCLSSIVRFGWQRRRVTHD